MNRKLFKAQELSGVIITFVVAFALSRLYYITRGNPVGVLFGSVNNSIWEQLKPLILGYFLYGGLELLTSKPYFRQFVASKTLGLYITALLYILLRSFLVDFYNIYLNAVLSILCLATGFLFSYKATLSKRTLGDLFAPCCFMLMLIFIMYFSFTAFSPRLWVFQDPDTCLYGIIPKHLDAGAIALDALC